MKKIFFILMLAVLAVSCSDSKEKEYDVMFFNLSETDRELFEKEIGVNERIYLLDFYDTHKVSEVAVWGLNDTLDEFRVDYLMTRLHLGTINGLEFDSLKFYEFKQGMEYSYSIVPMKGSNDVTYVFYSKFFDGGRFSYVTLPYNAKLGYDEMIKDLSNATKDIYPNLPIEEQAFLATRANMVNGYAPFFSAFNWVLSSGQTVRVFFVGSLK